MGRMSCRRGAKQPDCARAPPGTVVHLVTGRGGSTSGEAPRPAPRGPREGVVWITNQAAPYRRPVWDEIARVMPLRLVLLDSDASVARQGRRGADWAAAGLDFDVQHPPMLRVTRGERTFHIAPAGMRLGRSAKAVLLGGWESPAYWQALVHAKLAGMRAVGFYESTLATNRFQRGPIARARSWFFRHLDAVVVPGPAAGDAVRSFGVEPDRIFEGFNAVDVERFHIAQSRRQAVEPRVGHRFVYVGQLIERKNLRNLLAGFALMASPEDSLSFIGTGPLREELQCEATRLAIDDRVRFLGSVAYSELPDLLVTFDTLALVSTEEVWGLVVNEALAAGLHVVVADSAGVYASVRDMPGVHGTESHAYSICRALSGAISEWTGPIKNPLILQYNPLRFARLVVDAIAR